tara:strand:- start:152 stop:670 length:519 start_codon:yes stop_codon:yes gene_type:complete
MKRIGLLLIAGMLICPLAFAKMDKTLKPSVILNHIKVIQPQEGRGDELYFDVTVNRIDKRTFYQVPKHPHHWASKWAAKIKHVELWTDSLNEGETITLTLSLLDRDLTKINSDDLIGTVQIRMKNKGGVLHWHWNMPNHVKSSDTVVGDAGIQRFELFGEHAHYELYLSLKK